jgi:hypothetical protein
VVQSTNGSRPPGSTELAGILERIQAHIDGFVADLHVLGSVRADRIRERLRTSVSEAQRAVVFGLAVAALALAGIVVLALGALRAFDALFARWPGVGGIVAGLSLIAAAGILSAVRSVRARRALVRRLETKYAGMESGSRTQDPIS